jgi:fructokinase
MESSREILYGGIEAGGTKFVCAVGTDPDNIKAIETFPTTTPGDTLRKAAGFFLKNREIYPLAALGIASFGPLDLNPESIKFGRIVTTPKAGWSDTDLVGYFHQELAVPVILDTDVNGAALAENTWGSARGLDPVVYLTVGTGIGGGGIINGRPMRGVSHPEMGHIRIPHDMNEDPFPGTCPYHGDCLEGLASGIAIRKRWGKSPEDIPGGHRAWELEAAYLALAIVNYTYTVAPRKIIMGGGIMKKDGLLSLVREKAAELLAGYGTFPESAEDIASYIVPPGLGERSGVLGAIALARKMEENQ